MKLEPVKDLAFMVATIVLAIFTSTASAQLRSPDRPRVLLPEGPAGMVLRDNCVSCHGIDEYGFYSMSREVWDQMLDELHVGDLEIAMSSQERAILLDYLEDTFGEDDFALPREYTYVESPSFSNTDGRVFMESNCAGCHAHGINVAFDRQHTEQEWFAILMRERDRLTIAAPDDFARRGAGRFSDEILNKAAQWLGKVRGKNGG